MFDIEIITRDGYVDHYVVFEEEISNMIHYDNSNNSLRIFGHGSEFIDGSVKYIFLLLLFIQYIV